MNRPRRYHVVACHVLWREICHLASVSPFEFNFTFIEQGLHMSPDNLRNHLQEAIDAVNGDCEAILVGYGLCGKGIEGITARQVPLVFMRGHDCITFLLGSKERYKSYFAENTGTYWYSPGWIDTGKLPGPDYFEEMLATYTEKFGDDKAKMFLDMEKSTLEHYRNAAYVDMGVGDTGDYKDYTRTCAGYMDWNYEELKGDRSLLNNFLQGNWNAEDFLVVQPGQSVVSSFDESIIKAVDGDVEN